MLGFGKSAAHRLCDEQCNQRIGAKLMSDKSCTIKVEVSFPNGDKLEMDFPNVMDCIPARIVTMCQSNRAKDVEGQ
jgi:hypothetical protein